MSSPGALELLIVLAIVVLILGPRRLPSLGRQLGGGLREFADSIKGSGREPAREVEDTPVGRDARPPADARSADRSDRPAPLDQHRP